MVNYFVLVEHRGVQHCRRGAVLSTAMMEQWIQSNSCFGRWGIVPLAGDWVYDARVCDLRTGLCIGQLRFDSSG